MGEDRPDVQIPGLGAPCADHPCRGEVEGLPPLPCLDALFQGDHDLVDIAGEDRREVNGGRAPGGDRDKREKTGETSKIG